MDKIWCSQTKVDIYITTLPSKAQGPLKERGGNVVSVRVREEWVASLGHVGREAHMLSATAAVVAYTRPAQDKPVSTPTQT